MYGSDDLDRPELFPALQTKILVKYRPTSVPVEKWAKGRTEAITEK